MTGKHKVHNSILQLSMSSGKVKRQLKLVTNKWMIRLKANFPSAGLCLCGVRTTRSSTTCSRPDERNSRLWQEYQSILMQCLNELKQYLRKMDKFPVITSFLRWEGLARCPKPKPALMKLWLRQRVTTGWFKMMCSAVESVMLLSSGYIWQASIVTSLRKTSGPFSLRLAPSRIATWLSMHNT